MDSDRISSSIECRSVKDDARLVQRRARRSGFPTARDEAIVLACLMCHFRFSASIARVWVCCCADFVATRAELKPGYVCRREIEARGKMCKQHQISHPSPSFSPSPSPSSLFPLHRHLQHVLLSYERACKHILYWMKWGRWRRCGA
jgi:hypothetical protein